MTRLVPAAFAALLLVACGAPTASPSAASPIAGAADPIAVIERDFEITPAELSVDAGTVALQVTNEGPTPHNVTVRDADGDIVLATRNLRRGESEEISGTLESGEYTTYCSLPGHESLGMVGTLTVTDPPAAP